MRTGDWISSEILDEILGIGREYPHTREGWLPWCIPKTEQGATDYLVKEVIAQGRDCQLEYRIVRPAMEKSAGCCAAGSYPSMPEDRR